MELLASEPDLPSHEIAARLDVNRNTVAASLARLEGEGMIEVSGRQSRVVQKRQWAKTYRISPAAPSSWQAFCFGGAA